MPEGHEDFLQVFIRTGTVREEEGTELVPEKLCRWLIQIDFVIVELGDQCVIKCDEKPGRTLSIKTST